MDAYVVLNNSWLSPTHNGDGLAEQVNKLIEQGYTPIGGCSAGKNDTYLQAMYKKPTKPVEPQNEANDITELDLSKRTINMLLAYDIDIDELRTMSEIDLLKLPGCGRGTTNEILNELYRDGGME